MNNFLVYFICLSINVFPSLRCDYADEGLYGENSNYLKQYIVLQHYRGLNLASCLIKGIVAGNSFCNTVDKFQNNLFSRILIKWEKQECWQSLDFIVFLVFLY